MDQYQDAIWIERAATSLARGWELIALGMGERAATWDETWLADAASPNPFLNAATLRRPLQPAEAESVTARLDAYFSERPAAGPWSVWSCWPTPDLAPLGYALWGHPPIMLRPPGGEAPPTPPGLEIVEARDATTLAAIERGLIEGYPLLGLERSPAGCVFPSSLLGGEYRFWGGFVDGQVVSVSAAVLAPEHTDVFYVATLPAFRGRGYGTALTWTASLANSSVPAILEASEDGQPVYERMGFREIGRMSLWERPRDPSHPVFSPYAPGGSQGAT